MMGVCRDGMPEAVVALTGASGVISYGPACLVRIPVFSSMGMRFTAASMCLSSHSGSIL